MTPSDTVQPDPMVSAPPASAVDAVCPACRSGLDRAPTLWRCLSCEGQFALRGRFADLSLGASFEDRLDTDEGAYEAQCCADTTQRYWVPWFKRVLGPAWQGARVLSVGCGVGTEVDELVRAGFDAVGIDPGRRSEHWNQREQPQRLFLADGAHMPFADASFDLVFCGCLFPHLGDELDQHRPGAHAQQQRQKVAQEMMRVLRPDGALLVSGVNGACPLDLFHGRAGGSVRPRLNRRGDGFLLDLAAYRQLFSRAGSAGVRALPTAGFWTFRRSQRSLKGRLATWPLRCLFWLESRPWARALRASALSPWLVLLVSRNPRLLETRW